MRKINAALSVVLLLGVMLMLMSEAVVTYADTSRLLAILLASSALALAALYRYYHDEHSRRS